MNPDYPVYVISKGRWRLRQTSRALERMRVPYRLVIEPQEFDLYAAVVDPAVLLVLPFGNLGQGSIPARNWVWDHAAASGTARHWILDDNILTFQRKADSQRLKVADGTIFAVMEQFVDRYSNVAMAGPNYVMFAPDRQSKPPVTFNHRVYSCILLDNAIPFRWRGRYNEDTDLSLRLLKAGYCTVLYNNLLAQKQATMRQTGGNSDELYAQNEFSDGRLLMAQSLQRQHPDVTTIKRRWNRWQHVVDYRPFAGNRLIQKDPQAQYPSTDEFGMVLAKKAARDASH